LRQQALDILTTLIFVWTKQQINGSFITQFKDGTFAIISESNRNLYTSRSYDTPIEKWTKQLVESAFKITQFKDGTFALISSGKLYTASRYDTPLDKWIQQPLEQPVFFITQFNDGTIGLIGSDRKLYTVRL
jgi:hypothetical protein